MPYLDGVSAVRGILANQFIPIIMLSSLTYEGARTTLDALAAGAVDFIPKNFAEVSQGSKSLKRKLHDSLLEFARKNDPNAKKTSAKTEPESTPVSGSNVASASKTAATSAVKANGSAIDVVVIGASTGGPVAVADVLMALPKSFPKPLVIVQHMPEKFTKAFADRLDKHCDISIKEAVNGDLLKPGQALIAPGGHQLMFESSSRKTVKVMPGDDRVTYKPSVDVAFGSAANIYGGRVLAVVLTGMGADGCEGARLLHQKGSVIWAQDKETSTVYGMPMSVAKAELTHEILPLPQIGPRLANDLK